MRMYKSKPRVCQTQGAWQSGRLFLLQEWAPFLNESQTPRDPSGPGLAWSVLSISQTVSPPSCQVSSADNLPAMAHTIGWRFTNLRLGPWKLWHLAVLLDPVARAWEQESPSILSLGSPIEMHETGAERGEKTTFIQWGTSSRKFHKKLVVTCR